MKVSPKVARDEEAQNKRKFVMLMLFQNTISYLVLAEDDVELGEFMSVFTKQFAECK